MAGRALTIDITTRDQQTLAALKRIQRELHDTGSAAEATGRRSLGLKDAIGGIAIGAGLKFAVGEFEEAEVASRKTAAAIAATGNAAGVSAAEQDKLVQSLSKQAAVDDEVITGAADLLRNFKSIKGERFGETLAASLDVSAAKGIELSAAAQQLGKALESPANATKILRSLGIALTQQQLDQVKAMVAVGNTAGAQGIILDELKSRYDGQAEAAATSSAKMSVAWSNAAESLGASLAPALESAANVAEVASDAFSHLPEPLRTLSVVGAGAALVGPRIVAGLAPVGAKAMELATRIAVPTKAIEGLGTEAVGAGGKVGQLVSTVASSPVAWGAAAAGVGVLAAAYLEMSAASERAEKNTNDLIEGAKQGGKTLEDVFDEKLANTIAGVANGFSLEGSGKGFSEMVDRLGLSAAELKKILSMSEGDFKEWRAGIIKDYGSTGAGGVFVANLESMRGSLADANSKTKEQTQAQKELGVSAENAGDGEKKLAEDVQSAADGFASAVDKAHALYDAQDKLSSANEGMADAVRGVAEAQDGVTQAEQSLADAHRGVADAAKGVRDAEQGLADARSGATEAAQALAQAQHDAAYGTRDLEQANRGVVDAERALADAQRESKAAQEDLTAARDRARESLDDMTRSAEGAALAEESARLSLQEAQDRRASLGADATASERARAELAIRQADLALREAIDRNQDTAAQLADMRQRGVEGSDEVVAAQDRITVAADAETTARQQLTDAQQRVVDVQAALAQAVVDAQARVEDANRRVQDAQERVVESSQRVVDAQQRVVDAREGVVAARDAVTAAEGRVTDAQLAQIDAAAGVEEQAHGVEAATRLQIERYGELAATLDLNSPLRIRLEGLIADLREAAGDWNVRLNMTTYYADVGSAPPGFNNAERIGGGRAGGGPVRRGAAYIVGENRREVFSPNQDGTIYPSVDAYQREQAFRAREARRSGRSDTSNGGATINVTVPAAESPEATGRAVGRAIAWELALA